MQGAGARSWCKGLEQEAGAGGWSSGIEHGLDQGVGTVVGHKHTRRQTLWEHGSNLGQCSGVELKRPEYW